MIEKRKKKRPNLKIKILLKRIKKMINEKIGNRKNLFYIKNFAHIDTI